MRIAARPTVLGLLVFASVAAAGPATLGEHVPAFRLPGPAGAVSSDSLAGKVVYVDFWASWCEPCRRSFPWMRALHERYAQKGLAIVAIDLDHDRAAGEKFLAKYPAPFRVAFDPDGKTAEAFGVEAMPTSFLISRDGRVLERHAGFDPKKADALEESIRKECGP